MHNMTHVPSPGSRNRPGQVAPQVCRVPAPAPEERGEQRRVQGPGPRPPGHRAHPGQAGTEA